MDRIQRLHPAVRADAMAVYYESVNALSGRATVRFSQTLRTIPEQDALYAQGRTKQGKIVTNARGGASYHNYGLAIDIVLIIDGKEVSYDMVKDYDGDGLADWMECVSVFKSHGWAWGGEWKSIKDYPHFEKTFGKTVTQLKALYDKKKFIEDNQYVIL
ncbi:MAG: M15 family metallopeptidase [Nitrososphaeraceae archaeon]|nr:M15 family metallopeptidase [Nitrososphaeraceae archaeon]